MKRTKSGLANDAWEALLTSHATLMKGFAAENVWGDISMREYDVLYALSKCTTAMNIRELNKRVLLSQPAMSRLIDRMVADGYVSRVADTNDKRNVRLSLTKAGADVQRRIGRAHARSVARVMNVLSVSELEALEAIAKRLYRQV